MKKKEFLLVTTGGLGDFIFTIPAIYILRRSFPNDKLTVIYLTPLSKEYRKIAKNRSNSRYPWIKLIESLADEIIVCDPGKISDQLRLISRFMFSKINKLLLLYPNDTSNYSILKKKIFLKTLMIKPFCSVLSPSYISNKINSKHKSIGPLEVASKLIQNRSEINLYKKSPEDLLRIFLKFKKNLLYKIRKNNFKNKYICFFIGCNFEWKNWGVENYVELSEALFKHFHNYIDEIVLLGPGNDKHLIKYFDNDKVRAKFDLNFDDLISVISNSICVIGNDGGGMQLAGLLDVNSIVLANGSEPNLVTPMGNNVVELREFMSCSPCFSYKDCKQGHPACVKDVTVDRVLKEFNKLISF